MSSEAMHKESGSGRARALRQVALVALACNALLAVGQLLVGMAAHAQSLVADSIHTFSDLVGDILVLVAGRYSTDPADAAHPYGHGRIETIAALVIGSLVCGVGALFLWTSGARLQHPEALPLIHPAALVMALVALLAKETLFRYTLAAGRRLDAPMLVANAWHARTDAASSLVVAVGIAGSLLGYRFLEPLGAALVGFFILRMGYGLVADAVRELVDTGLDDATVEGMRRLVRETPGVVGLHALRTRRMANRVLCDIHVQVAPRISVSEGHYIAERVRRRLADDYPEVQDVLVHVDAENDGTTHDPGFDGLPDRHELMSAVTALIEAAGPPPDRVQLHYLNNRFEVEVFLPEEWLDRPAEVDALKQRMALLAARYPRMRALSALVIVAR